MCGIVGYIGSKKAYPILIKGLKRLEYRGYDSAGVAMISDGGNLNVYKAKGKVDNLTEYCGDKDVTGCVGIAHTRWATHGEPSARNAHPHYSKSHNLAIIHNGIIENYADIKSQLQAKGVEFKSDTDTEVLVQLVEYIMIKKNRLNKSLFIRFRAIVNRCYIFTFAIGFYITFFVSHLSVFAPLEEEEERAYPQYTQLLYY